MSLNCGSLGRWSMGSILVLGFALWIGGSRMGGSSWKEQVSHPRAEGESVGQAQPELLGQGVMNLRYGYDDSVRSQELNEEPVDFRENNGGLAKSEADWIPQLRAWCAQDPEAMTSWVTATLVGADRQIALKQAAVIWVVNDIEGAIRWAESLPAVGERNGVIFEIGFELARLKPERAIDLASKLPRSAMRDELLVHAVRQWAGIDPATASRWASDLPESRLRQEVLSALAVSLAADRGKDAAEVVALSMMVGKHQEDAAVLVARRWGMDDPELSADWIAGFPDPEVRRAALRELAATWSGRSPAQMSAWIESLADESLQNQMRFAVESLQAGLKATGQGADLDTEP